MSGYFTRMGSRIGVWLYRTTGGRAMNGAGPPRVLMLTTPGRVSGEPRSTCVASRERDGRYIVWGTGGGAPRDPAWFRDLRAAGRTRVQAGDRAFDADVRELSGPEREARWAEIAATVPGTARYAARAGRTIPVAILSPVEP